MSAWESRWEALAGHCVGVRTSWLLQDEPDKPTRAATAGASAQGSVAKRTSLSHTPECFFVFILIITPSNHSIIYLLWEGTVMPVNQQGGRKENQRERERDDYNCEIITT